MIVIGMKLIDLRRVKVIRTIGIWVLCGDLVELTVELHQVGVILLIQDVLQIHFFLVAVVALGRCVISNLCPITLLRSPRCWLFIVLVAALAWKSQSIRFERVLGDTSSWSLLELSSSVQWVFKLPRLQRDLIIQSSLGNYKLR